MRKALERKYGEKHDCHGAYEELAEHWNTTTASTTNDLIGLTWVNAKVDADITFFINVDLTSLQVCQPPDPNSLTQSCHSS